MIEKKILFIDDDKGQREIIKKILSKIGYSVEVAENGNDALDLLEKENFPLIITDLMMPDIDGTVLCKQIRKKNTESVIYALSGHIAQYDQELIEKIGFDGYLFKPVRINILQEAVEGAFEKIDQRKK